MNWLLFLALVSGSSAFSFALGWTLRRTVERRDAQAERIRASLARVTGMPANYAAWRYRR